MNSTNRPEGSQIGVWVDRDWDVGDGLAVDICPEHFSMAEDGLLCATDKAGRVAGLAIDGLVVVDPDLEDKVIEAADWQAADNIYLHYVKTDDSGAITHIWNVKQDEWEPWTIRPTYPSISIAQYVTLDTQLL